MPIIRWHNVVDSSYSHVVGNHMRDSAKEDDERKTRDALTRVCR